jgi:hypothetical protein
VGRIYRIRAATGLVSTSFIMSGITPGSAGWAVGRGGINSLPCAMCCPCPYWVPERLSCRLPAVATLRIARCLDASAPPGTGTWKDILGNLVGHLLPVCPPPPPLLPRLHQIVVCGRSHWVFDGGWARSFCALHAAPLGCARRSANLLWLLDCPLITCTAASHL